MSGKDLVVRSSLDDKITYAKYLAESGLLPEVYRRQPANVLYATEYGEMLGLAPLAAINGLHIIEGKPTASAGMVSSLVRRAGHRLRSGYDRKTGVGWCEIVRHDDPEFTYRAEWTLARAVDASLCELRNGKPYARDGKGRPKPWERYPEAMLKARAITECARDACEEDLNGVHYTPEELGADVDENGEPIKVTAVRADQVPTDPASTPPAQTAPAPVDWDAEITKCAGDYERLRALWSRASQEAPDDSDVLVRIMEAGKAAKAAGEEPVDADVIEENDGSPASDRPDGDTDQPAEPLATTRQLTKLHTQLGKLAVIGDADKHSTISLMIGRPITSTKELTKAEAITVIDVLDRVLDDQEPVAAFDYVLAELASAPSTPDSEEAGNGR